MFSPTLLDRMRRSPAWAGDRFRNRLETKLSARPSLSVLRRLAFEGELRRPSAPLPSQPVARAVLSGPAHDGVRATWLGHSTTLVEIGGRRVLLDPVWAERASPSDLFGPKRFQPVPLAIEAVPMPDVIIVSHDHYDHLDRDAILSFAARGARFVTTLGVGARLEQWGVDSTRVTQLDWWEQHSPVEGLAIHALPARHFSGRSLTDRDRTLWASWAIEANGQRVFFGGDGGMDEENFAAIGARFGGFDLTMLEVGAFDPSWASIHLGPERALEAQALLRSRLLLPVHWGTFDLAMHAWDEPVETLIALARGTDVALALPRIGESVVAGERQSPRAWWRAARGQRDEPVLAVGRYTAPATGIADDQSG
jgi:L-ascorbate metabolism protein UlaG (beta-lactamase superfamily)